MLHIIYHIFYIIYHTYYILKYMIDYTLYIIYNIMLCYNNLYDVFQIICYTILN